MTPRPHTVTLYRDDTGKWRWRRQAGNNRVVAASEQGFRTRWYAKRDARRDLPIGISTVFRYQ